MQDINSLLAEAEKIAARVTKQAEQEAAMAQTLPLRFSKNISAFERFIPEIAEMFQNYKPEKSFQFFCNDNGIPNLLWLESNIAIYSDDPYFDCKKQIEQVIKNNNLIRLDFSKNEDDLLDLTHVSYMNKLASLHRDAKSKFEIRKAVDKSVPLSIMFGVGLGYQLGYFYEVCTPQNLFIFEPDKDLFFASLFSFDWYSLLEYLDKRNLGLHIFVGQEESNLMRDMQAVLLRRGTYLPATILAFWHYPSETIFKMMEKVIQEFYLLSVGWGFFDDNILALSHANKNISKKTPFLLKNKKVSCDVKNTPIFVIGNGPSLDKAIPYIKKYKDNAILISCGSSISALHRANIKPDICVAIERTKDVADFYGILNDGEYLKNILFFGPEVVHPDCSNYFSKSALCFKEGEPLHLLSLRNFNEIQNFSVLNYINPLVGNIGLCFPIELGFENIFLFGLDNGYKDKHHHHSKLSAYYDKKGNHIEALTKIVTEQGEFSLPGNFGGEVIANRIFATSVKCMSVFLQSKNNVSCYNCSDGAFIDGTIPLHLESIDLNSEAIDKKNIMDFIYNDFFSPFPISTEELKINLNVDVFYNVVDDIIHHWDFPIKSKEDLSERMQQVHEYVYSLIEDGYAHVYRFLFGTITYLFSSITVLAYNFSDEKETLQLVNEAVQLMIEYLEEIKIKYPFAFDSIDETGCNTIHLYERS